MADPVLLPPDEPSERPLPRWTLYLALLGLAILCGSTVPASLEHRRLDRHRRRLLEEARRQEQSVLHLVRTMSGSRNDLFERRLELDRLLHPPAEPSDAAPASPRLRVR